VLKEALLSKELDVEQLESDLASSLRIQDVMRNEIQRVQDELSCMNHKAKHLELQVDFSYPYSPTKPFFETMSSLVMLFYCIILKKNLFCYFLPSTSPLVWL
jgi:hypothetical protein